jgi:hypothetical protein
MRLIANRLRLRTGFNAGSVGDGHPDGPRRAIVMPVVIRAAVIVPVVLGAAIVMPVVIRAAVIVPVVLGAAILVRDQWPDPSGPPSTSP